MHKIQFEGENNTVNKMIWPVIAVIGSLKMGITSLEILFYENMETIKYFRMSIFVLVIIGIIILIYGLIKMNKHKTAFMEYKNCIHNNKIVITGILFAYVIIALMPVYMKPASPP
jgi:uncharacterized membrane protein